MKPLFLKIQKETTLTQSERLFPPVFPLSQNYKILKLKIFTVNLFQDKTLVAAEVCDATDVQ